MMACLWGLLAGQLLCEGSARNLQKKANRNITKTMAMPTGSVLAPPGDGVCVSTVAAINMHIPIPIPPTMKRNLRPKRSTVQVALSVKMIPKVALRALIRATVSELLKTFL